MDDYRRMASKATSLSIDSLLKLGEIREGDYVDEEDGKRDHWRPHAYKRPANLKAILRACTKFIMDES